MLGEAGVLDGKHATTWAGGEKQLAAAYPKIKVEVVVPDDLADKVAAVLAGGSPAPTMLALRASWS